jgi:hypothetical protein
MVDLVSDHILYHDLSKPQPMSSSRCDKDDDPSKNKDIKVDENRTMTVLLGEK